MDPAGASGIGDLSQIPLLSRDICEPSSVVAVEVPTRSTDTVTGCYPKELTGRAEKASLGPERGLPQGRPVHLLRSWRRGLTQGRSLCSQMEVIVGDFGIVVVPRDAADTDRIMNHSSILRKYKVSSPSPRGPSSVACSFLEGPAVGEGEGAGRGRAPEDFKGEGWATCFLCSVPRTTLWW